MALQAAATEWWDKAYPEAVAYLLNKGVVTREEFNAIEDWAKGRAFTVTGVNKLDVLQTVLEDLVATLTDGGTLRDFADTFDETLSGAGLDAFDPWRVETIFRTNIQSAYGRGSWENGTDPEIADEIWGWRYWTVGDDRVREEHAALEGLAFETGEADQYFPPWDYNSLLPGALVSGEFYAASKVGYAGEAVEVLTESGKRTTVTAHHPVLTPEGFVRAYLLHEGDYAICERGLEGTKRDVPYEQHGPMEAEQAFKALAKRWAGGRGRLAGNDLHGHEVGGKREVHVVAADRVLLNRIQSTLAQRSGKFGFSSMDLAKTLVTSLRSLNPLGQRHFASTGALVGGAGLRLPLGWGHAGPLQAFRVGLAAKGHSVRAKEVGDVGATHSKTTRERGERRPGQIRRGSFHEVKAAQTDGTRGDLVRYGARTAFDSAFAEQANEWCPAQSEFLVELLKRRAGQIAAEKIVRVRKFDYSGHVYDFSSPSRLIISDSIGISNCRCSAEWLTNADAEEEGLKASSEIPEVAAKASEGSDFASPALTEEYDPDLTQYNPTMVSEFIKDISDEEGRLAQ